MPLEISEIAVRLAVDTPTGIAAAAPKDGKGGAGHSGGLSKQQHEDLVRSCTREVLNALRAAGER